MITDDDADDADFMPYDATSDGDEDDGDDISGVDGELAKVTRHEIQDLMDGCWQTIAGPKDSNTSSYNEGKEIKAMDSSLPRHTDDNVERAKDSTTMHIAPVVPNQSGDSTFAEACGEKSIDVDIDTSNRTKSEATASSFSPSSSSSLDAARLSHNNSQTMQKGRIHDKGSGVVVSHLLSESRYTDLCLDEMPVCVIRNLLTRQINMAIQLLLQMLLISDHNSECFNRYILYILITYLTALLSFMHSVNHIHQVLS